MSDRLRELQQATVSATLRGPGTTTPAVRQAVASGEAPDDLRPLVAKVRNEPWAVTDEDWAPLRARYSEDELFELVVAAVVGAADHRFDAAIRVLDAS